MTDTRITEILREFEIFDGVYKRAQVDAALELQEEITPHLIGILEQVLRDPAAYVENPDRYAHIYALVLLGHFREQRAHKVIVDLFSLPTDLPYQLVGDLVTEDLPSILFKTCGGSTDLIRSMILNKNADDYCRSSAARAMVFATADGIIPRDEVLALFGSLFTGNEASADSEFWSLLAGSLYDLYPEGMMDVIEKAYEDELISPGFIGSKISSVHWKLEENARSSEQRRRCGEDHLTMYMILCRGGRVSGQKSHLSINLFRRRTSPGPSSESSQKQRGGR